MISKIQASDWVSLVRFPLSAAFVIFFDVNDQGMVWLCIALAVVAQISDHIDGWLAKRNSKTRLEGWLFDSVSDRAFYIAAVIAFSREYHLIDVIVWAFCLREICLYAIRVSVGDFASVVSNFRPITLAHAGIVRIAIILGLIFPILPFQTVDLDVFSNYLSAVLTTSIVLGFSMIWMLVRK